MPHPRLTIVTGHSRGLGHALTAALLQHARAGDAIVGIARSDNASLRAPDASVYFDQWQADLADAAPVAQRLEAWLAEQRQAQTALTPNPSPGGRGEQARPENAWCELRLINNAGLIPTIAPLAQLGAADITRGLRVGLEAAMLLSSAFLRATENWPAASSTTPATAPTRKVLNISSGLGRRPMASQAVYCAAKAGMDLFSRCLALEEAAKPAGARVVSLAPGVIATDMQQHLRSADPAAFPDLPRFQGLLQDGLLQTPQDTATRILQRLDAKAFGENVVDDVRES